MRTHALLLAAAAALVAPSARGPAGAGTYGDWFSNARAAMPASGAPRESAHGYQVLVR